MIVHGVKPLRTLVCVDFPRLRFLSLTVSDKNLRRGKAGYEAIVCVHTARVCLGCGCSLETGFVPHPTPPGNFEIDSILSLHFDMNI